jgi:hypothetical protein
MHQGLLFHAFFQSFNELVTARLNLVLHIKDGLMLTTPLAFEGFQVLLQAALFFDGLRQTGTALGVTITGFGVQQGLFSSEDLVIRPVLQLFAFTLEALIVLVQCPTQRGLVRQGLTNLLEFSQRHSRLGTEYQDNPGFKLLTRGKQWQVVVGLGGV